MAQGSPGNASEERSSISLSESKESSGVREDRIVQGVYRKLDEEVLENQSCMERC